MKKKITMKLMCETIAKSWKKRFGITVKPKDIFNHSKTGELTDVFFWYQDAVGE